MGVKHGRFVSARRLLQCSQMQSETGTDCTGKWKFCSEESYGVQEQLIS